VKYIELTNKFHSFKYKSYEYTIEDNELKLLYKYELIGDEIIIFNHKVTYNLMAVNEIEQEHISNFELLIFHIGMVETINYWKLACPKKVIVECGYLSEEQKKWWKKLYYNGLGEFIYLNNIVELVTEDTFVEFETIKHNKFSKVQFSSVGNLIPVGGGKDSVVTLEVLKNSKHDNLPFVMSAPIAAYDCISVAGYTKYLEAKRIFDIKMIKMNNEGYLNGHVPFSAILAFVATLGAALTGKRFIPLSNERSANEPSVIGTSFNHQYSKSFEFEEDFSNYLHHFLTEDISYFSLLRPLYEIQIGEMFANYRKYHQVYRSCNRGKKDNSWCGVCPKCLFVYIILSPYIPREELIAQFGKDLLDDESLIPIFDELIGRAETKPFECVGTMWEVRRALNLTLLQFSDAKLLEYYLRTHGEQLSAEPSEYEEGDLLPEYHELALSREMSRIEKYY